jgi:hypothetical protein
MKLIKEIREEIMKKGPDSIWTHDTPGDISAVCSTMKQWIREIPEGLIFGSGYEAFVKASGGFARVLPAREI